MPFMPTVRENIAYTFEHVRLVDRGTLLKVARAVAIIALSALALEVFVFNINFFTSSGYRTINLDDRIQLRRNDEGAFLLTDVDHTLEFSSLNTEVRNIRTTGDLKPGMVPFEKHETAYVTPDAAVLRRLGAIGPAGR